AGKIDHQVEQQLWAQLADLSAAAAPATAETIRDSKYYRIIFGENNKSEDRSRGGRQRIASYALGFFIFSFLVGGYLQVTDKALVELRSDIVERNNIIDGHYGGTRLAGLDEDAATTDAQKAAVLNAKYNANQELQAEIEG